MQPFMKNVAVEYAAKALPDGELKQALDTLQQAIDGKIGFDLDLGTIGYPGSYRLNADKIALIRSTMRDNNKKLLYCKIDGQGPAPASIFIARTTSSVLSGIFPFDVFFLAFSSGDYSGDLHYYSSHITTESNTTLTFYSIGTTLYKHVIEISTVPFKFVIISTKATAYDLGSLYSGSWKNYLVRMYCQAVGSGVTYPCDYMNRYLPNTGIFIPSSPTSIRIGVINQVDYVLQDSAVVRNVTYHLKGTTVSSMSDTVTPL